MIPWQAQAKHFLENEKQFHLGMLPTEQSHPKTRGLSGVLQNDIEAGLRMLQAVDREVVDVAERVFAGEAFVQLTHELTEALLRGGQICFSGCGATGRLSILLEACWRRFWQEYVAKHPDHTEISRIRENQVCSIMTGGDYALIRSVENFEDHMSFGRRQVQEANLGSGDVLVAISEGGETSSVIGTIWEAHERGAQTFFAFNNPAPVLAEHIERSRDVIENGSTVILDLTSGPMAVAGSTRMQATTSELLVVGAALDLACAAVLPSGNATENTSIPRRTPHNYAREFADLLSSLGNAGNVSTLAGWVRFEKERYEKQGRITYFADQCLLDIFTDTTERAPTFMLPPFRKCDDKVSPPSWAFVKNPLLPTPQAWERVLRRPPRCLTWDPTTYAGLKAPADVQASPPVLDANAIRKFLIGNEDDPSRYTPDSAAAVLAILGRELPADGNQADIIRAFARAAVPFPGHAAVVIGKMPECDLPAGQLFNVECEIPPTRMRLWERLAVKLAFNTVSTATMGCMGRLASNWMAHVETSNKKLIDRGTRLVAELANVDYETACYALHETNANLKADLCPGDEKPSPVALTIERLKLEPV